MYAANDAEQVRKHSSCLLMLLLVIQPAVLTHVRYISLRRSATPFRGERFSPLEIAVLNIDFEP